MVILMFVSYAIVQITTSSNQAREKIQSHGEFFSRIRLSMNIMDRDISSIYSPILMLPDPEKKIDDERYNEINDLLRGAAGRSNDFWSRIIDGTGIRPSRFQGDAEAMSFISSSHVRVYRGKKESVFMKVRYYLKEPREPNSEVRKTIDGKILVKSEDVDAFNFEENDSQQIKEYRILEGIQSLKFEYYDREKERWYPSWDTDREESLNRFPDVIRVSLDLKGENNLFYDGEFQFRPEIPINEFHPSY